MNLLSEHNRILRVGEGGGGIEYTAGPNIDITNHIISGRDWGDDIGDTVISGISSTSGNIVNEAYNQSTAWVDEQGYLTAHQDVTNLPYVQNSALESNGILISGISGSGFFAESANNSYHSDDSYHADYAGSAESASYAESAGYTELADSAHVADYAVTAESAYGLVNGYSGIAPIVVDNERMLISAQSAKLGVQGPLYFVEDTSASTIIGIDDSAFPTFEGTPEGKISAINGSALNADPVIDYSAGNNIDITDHVISVTGSVTSADRSDYAVSATSSHFSHSAIEAGSANSATYDNLGREITATYLTAEVEYSAGANIDITNHVVSGKDWTTDIQNASSYAYDQATAQIPAVTGLPYVENSALDYTPGGHLVSSISGDAIYAVSAEGAFNAETANYSYVAETANYVADGWEYNESNEITGYSGSAIHSEAGGEGKVYTGVAPIVVDNTPTTGVISAQTASLGVQSPLYFVTDTSAQTVIGISGLPEVEGLMYESALGLTGSSITSYNGSAFSAQGGSNPQVPVSGESGIYLTKNNGTVFIGYSGIPTLTVATSAEASGSNILYIVTGS